MSRSSEGVLGIFSRAHLFQGPVQLQYCMSQTDCHAEQLDEVEALQAIFPEEIELTSDDAGHVELSLLVSPDLPGELGDSPLFLRAAYQPDDTSDSRGYNMQSPAPALPVPVPATEANPKGRVVSGDTAKPRLSRSISGFAEVEVRHLPPVQLQLKLPAGYPSSEPPNFRLSCSWMDLDSLSSLCRSLDDQWEQAKGSAIIYTWVDVLRQEVLELILKNRGALEGKIFLTLKAIDGLPASDPRTESNCWDPVQTLLDLLMYDKGKRLDIWSQQQHLCNVCFCEHPGSHFVHLGGCSHAFCKTCVKTMAEIHVNEGSISDLVCPETGCRAEIAPSALMQVLDESGYERWQTLKLRRALTTANLVLCPRCEEMGIETPVLPDPVSDSDQVASLPPVARCGRCEYVFCATCLSLYHGTEPCLAPEERAQQAAMRRLGTAQSVAEKRKLKREAQKGYLVCIDVGEDMLPVDAAGHITEDCEPNVAEGDKVIAVHTGVPDKITGRALWDAKFDNICNLSTVLMDSPRHKRDQNVLGGDSVRVEGPGSLDRCEN